MRLSPPLQTMFTAALAATISGCFVISGSVNPFSRSTKPLEERTVSGRGSDRIVLLDITGPITSQSSGGTFGLGTRESTVALVDAALRKARDDDRVRALILRINSPGGTVTASDILYNEIKRFRRDTNLPVIAEIHDIGASGAYYAALAADEIVAHPTSVVGSIGVLMQSVSVSGLMKKVGVTDQTITTGNMKASGSPLQEMTPAQRQVLQSVVDDMYDRFVTLVVENRPNLTEEMDRQMRDGRVFSAPQALAGGLVDRIEYLDQTIERTKRKVGLREATVVMYRQPDEYVRGLYSQGGSMPVQMNLLNIAPGLLPGTPRLLYQWIP